VIQIRGLDVRYPEARALRSVDLTIAAGSFVLVAGPSGGGKSTLAHALMGLIPQTIPAEVRGRISIAGLDPQQHGVAQLAARVGLVFQNPATQLFNGTVEEEIAFGPRNLGLSRPEIVARVDYGLQAMDCAQLRRRAVRHLSGGEQQRVAIAAVLAMRPSFLILDEPTANLDTEGVRSIVATLARLRNEFGLTLLVIEHRLAPFLPHADRLVWLAEGRVVADGPPAEIWARVRPAPLAHLPRTALAGEPLVALRGVTAGYNHHPVFQDCSLVLRRGEFAALVGPNGAGKTTLARVLAGVLRPRRGRVVWSTNGRAPRVGLLQQNPLHQLICDTVEEEVCFGPRNMGKERLAEIEVILSHTDLLPLRDRATRALSVGQQQRAALAAALGLHPQLVILDEPTIGQDWEHLVQVMDYVAALNQTGQTILLITHDERLVERYAGRVWQVVDGRVERCKRQEARSGK